jgi:hypothetical protein
MNTIKRSKLSKVAMVAGGEKSITRVIDNNRVMNWVGIGWIDEGHATTKNKKEYPTVID